MNNTFGKLFRVTTFGESHGPAIGAVIDGCPAGLEIDEKFIQSELDRRKPGQSDITSPRKESDEVQFLSGIFEGKTLGTPITLLIKNEDAKSDDYSHLKTTYRPSHADLTWETKYGIRDHRGGGRSSARETAARVAAGAVAKLLLNKIQVTITAYVSAVGAEILNKPYCELDLTKTEHSPVRCPDEAVAKRMLKLIEEIRDKGDTVGGIISCVIQGAPAGLGEPVFDKLHAELGKAILSINAVKGFEYGSGFEAAGMFGSQHNDEFFEENGEIKTRTNFSGGIQGGISNSEDIYFKTAFKPVATLMQDQKSIDQSGKAIIVEGKGRHDPCVVPRAVPIVEAMAALTLADFYLRSRINKL